jgi:hypothetical protein
MTRLLRLAVPCALVGALGVLAGCGGGAAQVERGEPISFEQLSQAATTSADATSGRFSFSLEMTMPGTSEPFAFSGDGAFDANAERAAFSLDLSSFAELLGGMLSGLGAPAGAGPDFDDPSAWHIEVVQDGEVMYMRFPAVSSELPSGKSWVRMGLGAAARTQGFDLSELQALAGNDPRDVLELLRAASDEIETVGTEELRGVATTHYRAVVSLLDYEKLVPESTSQELGPMLGEILEQTGLDELPVDVWLDAEGFVRRLDMSFSATQPGTGQSVGAELTYELFDYGKVVEVELPPAAEVVDTASLD